MSTTTVAIARALTIIIYICPDCTVSMAKWITLYKDL